jgi:hypothetical protein
MLGFLALPVPLCATRFSKQVRRGRIVYTDVRYTSDIDTSVVAMNRARRPNSKRLQVDQTALRKPAHAKTFLRETATAQQVRR